MPVLRSATAGSGEAPKQFSQPSRKGKKAWRKNVDVTEVEEGLREVNDEIIRGGVIREKASEDLFTIDTTGDSKIPQKFPKHVKKGLKADEIINKRSAVPAVSMRKRPSDKTTDGVVPAKRQRTDWVSHKDLARLKKVADGHHENTVAVRDATFDLWDAPAPVAEDPTDFLPEKIEAKVPKSMKLKPLSLLANGKQAPAVPKPTGGYSYNPSFPEYESRLAEESTKALEAEQKRLEAEAAEAAKLEAAAKSAAEADAAEERANMSEWEEDSEWEGFQSGVEDERPSVKQPKRKTQAQRNRIKRRKEEEQLEQRIKEIAAEVAEKEKEKALELAKAAEQDSDADSEIGEEKLRRRQLGKYKLPEKDLELVLPDELQESLRLLKPEGNLLKDRYRSLLLRGKVESRRHIPFKKQAKTKVTEKWTHKDFVL
ncbi:nop53 (60S ribosomal biogenesis) domain-containing protein [Trichoderma breve]|uniref:Ribosome biogenesis protein NOP53 n=1 Tax=Trichoderma breve TaxID=2034170 RepID=A0A9W9B7R0_9HYPO|nr:nop53 (60S ribosomal biogenesis) domain-containing protein [Trichoderma breve]KAJ4857504.1 nop53 (60S ribosomal biogenesis) domain-containing protein [Trichoderma breve]